MNTSECAKKVLDWAVRNVITASTEYAKAQCYESSRLAGEKTWKEYNPDDGVGGFGCNPYLREKERSLKSIERTAKEVSEANDTLAFVKNKICSLIV